MGLPPPPVRGPLTRRYKRFLADVRLASGEELTVHVANPGAMTGLAAPGARVWLSKSENPKRKLAYSWELVEVDFGGGVELVGVNTGHPTGRIAEARASGLIPELAGYASVRREVRYGKNSRVDLLLTDSARPPCYLEIKNVHLMRQKGLAEFPDAVTRRGANHLDALAAMVAAGHRAVMLFLIQIGSATRFSLASDIDPAYAAAFARARARGGGELASRPAIAADAIVLAGAVPIEPAPPVVPCLRVVRRSA